MFYGVCVCVLQGRVVAGDFVGGGGVGRFWGMKRSHKILRARFIHK